MKARPSVPDSRAGRGWIRWVALGAVFVVKAVIAWQLRDHPLLQPDTGLDTAAYVRLAERVAQGDFWLGPGLYYLSPLYVYFLAAARAIAGSFDGVRLLQALLGTAAVGFVFATAREWFGTRAAWIAAALAALTGELSFYEVILLQSAIDPVLTAATLWCLARALRGDAAWRWFGATGVLLGLEFLNRPNVLVAAVAVAIALVAARRLRAAGLVTAGLVIALSPVVLRNLLVSGQFALSSSQGGLNFYIGNHQNATGQYQAVPGVRADIEGQAEDTRAVAERAAGRSLTDAEVSGYFSHQAFDWIASHPVSAAALLVKKGALVFNARHQWLDFSYPYYAYDLDTWLRGLIVGPWLLIPLGLVGLLIAAPVGRRPAFRIWAAFVPGYAAGVMLFFVAERYRLPLLIALAITSGGAVEALLTARDEHRARVFAAAGTVAALGCVIAYWPFHLDSGRLAERLRLSKVLLNRRDYGAAAEALQHAYDLKPDDATIEYEFGMALMSAQRSSDGLTHLRHAVDAGVAIPGARYGLINAMLATGDRNGAVRLLRASHPAPDDSAESCYNVGELALAANVPEVAVEYFRRALFLRPGWEPPTRALAGIGLAR